MKKFWLVLAAVLLLPFAAVSQESQEAELVRYEGFAVGAYFSNSYATGKWAKHISSSIGGGINGEYTLPFEFSTFDLGAALNAEIASLIPNETGNIETATDISVLPGVFIRVPFTIGKITMSFNPELCYGLIFHKIQGKDDAIPSGIFSDQIFFASLGIRVCIPKFENMEFELTPAYQFAFETSGILFQAGFRTGLIWHFSQK